MIRYRVSRSRLGASRLRGLLCGTLLISSLFGSSHAAGQATTEVDLSRLIGAAASYQSGQSMESLRRLEALGRESSTDPGLRRQLEAGLVLLLAPDSTLEAKQFACQQLATIGTESSIPALAALLRTEETVGLACQALSTHPSRKAGEALRQALPELTSPARVQVINTLGDRQDAAAVEPLTPLATAPDAATAAAAILALGKISSPAARAVVTALADRVSKGERPELAQPVFEASMISAERLNIQGERDAAVAIYERLLDPSHPDNVRRGAFESLLQLDEDGGESRILATLRGTDSLLKPVAITGMRALRSPAASEKFAAALPSLSATEQVWLVEALAERRDDFARRAVLESLDSTTTAVRLAAIEGVARFAEPATVLLLCRKLVAGASPAELTALERTLTTLPHQTEFDEALIEQFEQAPVRAKTVLVRVLERRGSRAAIPALLRATEQPEFAGKAFQALGSLADAEDIPALLGKLLMLKVADARSDAEHALAQALRQVDNRKRRADVVLSALQRAQKVDDQCSLLRLLPVCADERSLEALTSASNHSEPRVRDTAVRALTQWPDAGAWRVLTSIVRQNTNTLHAALAFDALARLAEEQYSEPTEESVERYGELLAIARTDDDRKRVLGALANIAHPGALSLTLPLLDNPEVRDEAALAARKIAQSITKEHPKAADEALKLLEQKP